jgi:hypothetical protein
MEEDDDDDDDDDLSIQTAGYEISTSSQRDKLILQEWGFCGWVGNPPPPK